jgi:hypothetical protein
VLDEVGAQKRLGDMWDGDGCLLFCYSKRREVKKYPKNSREYRNWIGCSMCGMKPCMGCNGNLILGLEIKDYFKPQEERMRCK